MLTSLHLHMKSRRVCIKTRSPPASLPFKGQVTEHTTVKWPILAEWRLGLRRRNHVAEDGGKEWLFKAWPLYSKLQVLETQCWITQPCCPTLLWQFSASESFIWMKEEVSRPVWKREGLMFKAGSLQSMVLTFIFPADSRLCSKLQ